MIHSGQQHHALQMAFEPPNYIVNAGYFTVFKAVYASIMLFENREHLLIWNSFSEISFLQFCYLGAWTFSENCVALLVFVPAEQTVQTVDGMEVRPMIEKPGPEFVIHCEFIFHIDHRSQNDRRCLWLKTCIFALYIVL